MRLTILLLLACSLGAHAGVKPRLPAEARRTLDAQLSAGLPAQAPVAALLAANRLGIGWSLPALRAIAGVMGVRILPGVDALPTAVQTRRLNLVLNEYSKLPLTVIQRLRERRKAMDIVAGRLTNHPALASLRGGVVDTHDGETWDDLPAVGANGDYSTRDEHPTVLVLDADQGARSTSVVLHEMGHNFDNYYFNASQAEDYSSSPTFQAVFRTAPWTRFYEAYQRDYHRQHSSEHFAEQFARYFSSDESRERMRAIHPATYEYFRGVFGD